MSSRRTVLWTAQTPSTKPVMKLAGAFNFRGNQAFYEERGYILFETF